MEIREVLQDERTIFYELMGEVEYSLFNMENKKHLEWLKRRIDRLYYSGAKFFGGFDEAGSALGIITILIDEAPDGINEGFNNSHCSFNNSIRCSFNYIIKPIFIFRKGFWTRY